MTIPDDVKPTISPLPASLKPRPALIDIAGRLLVSADQVKLVAWRPLRDPYIEDATGLRARAVVTIETWHGEYRVPCATAAEARDLYALIRDCLHPGAPPLGGVRHSGIRHAAPESEAA